MARAAEHSYVEMGTQMAVQGYDTDCWGCGQHLHLPVFNPIFKCAWCGAVTIVQPKPARRSKWKSRLTTLRERVLVLVVLIIIFSIVCGGVWAVFPVFFSHTSLALCFHSAITCALAFNVLFNFVLASSRAAGKPPPLLWGKVGLAAPGALEGHRFCVPCHCPKPPRVHHCSTCQCCVVDMDHHCPFIGNCVGAGNHRHFLLFLFFTCLSCFYVFLMSTLAGIQMWPSVIRFYTDEPFREIGIHWFRNGAFLAAIVRVLVSSQVDLSVRAVSLIYLVVASLSVLIGVGVLLYQQLSMLYHGNGSYIDSMQAEASGVVRGITVSEGWVNLRRVFGGGHPLLWILPSFHTNLEIHSQKFHAI